MVYEKEFNDKQNKIKLYKILIRLVFILDHLIINIKKGYPISLKTFERNILRKVYGLVKQGKLWKIQINNKIEELIKN